VSFEIKSDVYEKPINSLVFCNNPLTIKELDDLLSDNGYFGRFKITKINLPKSQDVCVKVSVYLPDSVFTYDWPFDTYYNLTTRSLGTRKIPAIIKKEVKLLKCMYFFLLEGYNLSNNIEAVAEIGSLSMGWATKKEYVQLIMFLSKAGFFRKGWFVLKSKDDVSEIYENLFSPTYF
jgi:hypothetical protein